MKIGAAAALVGAVVAEVTKSEDGGLGARLLAGSYYGQTVQIWAALFAAAALSAALVGLIALAGRIVLRRMAFTPMNARAADLAPPLLFGLAVLAVWEVGVQAARRAGDHPAGALGDPAAARHRPTPTLAADFLQTIRGVLAGYAIGSGAGLAGRDPRSTARRSCSAGCCRSAISSRRCRSSASRRSW